jgi:selenocysteine lyase/cysteine desulfurase
VAADARAAEIQGVADDLGRLVGAYRRNIALAQNSTAAFAQALGALDFAPGEVILTSRADYASNQIMYLSLARRRGVEIVRAPDLAEGGVDPEAVRELVRHRRPALVAITWVPTNSGLMQEVAGRGCRAAEYHLVDARGWTDPRRRGDRLRLPGCHRRCFAAQWDRLPLVADQALERAHPPSDMHGAT